MEVDMTPKFLLLFMVAICMVPKRWYITTQDYRPLDKWRSYTITRKPCRGLEGKQGVCMFRWDCINMNGLMLSACMDGFLFGACCYIEHKNLSSTTLFHAGQTSSTVQADSNIPSSKDTYDMPYTKVLEFASLSSSINTSPISSRSSSEPINASTPTFEDLSEELPKSSEDYLVTVPTLIYSSLQETETLLRYNSSLDSTSLLTRTFEPQISVVRTTLVSTVVITPVLDTLGSIEASCILSDSIDIVSRTSSTNSINYSEQDPEGLYISSSVFMKVISSSMYLPTISYSDDKTTSPALSHTYAYIEDDQNLPISSAHFTKEMSWDYAFNTAYIHKLNTSVLSMTPVMIDLENLKMPFVDRVTPSLTGTPSLTAQTIQSSGTSQPIDLSSTILMAPHEDYTSHVTVLSSTGIYLLQVLDSEDGSESIINADSIKTSLIFDSVRPIVHQAYPDVISQSYYPQMSASILSSDVNVTGAKINYGEECGIKYLRSLGRIVGGKNTYFGKWPWQVLVKESSWLGIHVKNKCGGVLINAFYVLTAAHCQPGFLASLMVILGEHDLSNDHEELKPVKKDVKRMVVHRDYNSQTLENDLALLELESTVEFQPHILPICLPERGEDFTDQMAFVTGWGKLSHGGTLPTVLQEVRVPIISNSRCQQMFLAAGHIKAIRDTFVCAGYDGGGQDSCEGDSGGPLMVQRPNERWVLVGTVSHGIRCADPNLPGVYMRTAAYRAWIDNIIKPKVTPAT